MSALPPMLSARQRRWFLRRVRIAAKARGVAGHSILASDVFDRIHAGTRPTAAATYATALAAEPRPEQGASPRATGRIDYSDSGAVEARYHAEVAAFTPSMGPYWAELTARARATPGGAAARSEVLHEARKLREAPGRKAENTRRSGQYAQGLGFGVVAELVDGLQRRDGGADRVELGGGQGGKQRLYDHGRALDLGAQAADVVVLHRSVSPGVCCDRPGDGESPGRSSTAPPPAPAGEGAS